LRHLAEKWTVYSGERGFEAPPLAALKLAYVGATGIASQAGLADGGAADAKDAAETQLEDKAFEVARALAVHFKKENELVSRAKVDVTISSLRKLRDEALVSKATEIRDLGTPHTNDCRDRTLSIASL
jgi:hypothetical protein